MQLFMLIVREVFCIIGDLSGLLALCEKLGQKTSRTNTQPMDL